LISELAALGAALSWAIGSLFAVGAAKELGGFAFTRIRVAMVFVVMLAFVAVRGVGEPILASDWPQLIISGVIGIFIGDTALFVTLSRLGPRRTGILFACNAPFTVILAWLILDENLNLPAVAGCVLVAAGVVIAIVYGKRRDQVHVWESVRGRLSIGILIGLLAALGQAVSSLLLAPTLAHGADPVTVTTIRMGIALVALYALRFIVPDISRAQSAMTAILFTRTLISGMLGMAIGMSLLLFAFAHGAMGISAALSSTTPVMLIPIIWILSRERPAAGAWAGAVLAVSGIILIVLRNSL